MKTNKTKTWLIVCDHNLDNSFEVEAKNLNEAKSKALNELGWGVVEYPQEEDPRQLKLFKD